MFLLAACSSNGVILGASDDPILRLDADLTQSDIEFARRVLLDDEPGFDGEVAPMPDNPFGDDPPDAVEESATLSDEQSFAAVADRETIESDFDRINSNRTKYVIIQPQDLPQRPVDAGANIVAFALATSHSVGVPTYKRGSRGYEGISLRCVALISSDLAQQAFLEAGGPQKDGMRLDPDGDGYACTWDPEVFRL